MTSRNRARTAVVAALVAAGLTGCADTAGDAGAPGSVAGEGPARPGAGGGDLVVDALPLEAPVVLDPVPDGLLLTGLSYRPPGDDLQYNDAAGGYEPARATLYGDPDLADTLDGPVLLVGTSTGSATIAGPGYEVPGEQVDLGGEYAGRVVPDSDRTWVVLEGNDYTEFVVGRGIDGDELVAAARGADFASATTALAPDVVPAGLEPLVAGSAQDRPGSGSGVHMFLRGDGSQVTVNAVRADPRLAALLGFWLEDATGTPVRGHPGSAGDLQGANVGDPDARGRVWAEDGLVFSVVVTGGAEGGPAGNADQLLDQVVEALRVGTWEEFEALDGETQGRPPTALESPCPSDRGFVSGVAGETRWIFQLQPDPFSGWGEWSVCSFDLTSGGGSGGSFLPPPVGELGTSGFGSGIVGGVAPPGTVRVAVTPVDGSTLEAVLAPDDGPRPGERVWGSYIPLLPPAGGGAPFTVTAYDAAGAVLDSVAR